MNKKFLIIAGIFGALGVILGAFGAHSLKSVLSEYQLSIFKTGIQYHFYHTFALLGLALFGKFSEYKYLKTAAWLFVIGILFFSGSLYLLACREVLNLNSLTPILGPITPIGGMLFLFGWCCIIWTGIRMKNS